MEDNPKPDIKWEDIEYLVDAHTIKLAPNMQKAMNLNGRSMLLLYLFKSEGEPYLLLSHPYDSVTDKNGDCDAELIMKDQIKMNKTGRIILPLKFRLAADITSTTAFSGVVLESAPTYKRVNILIMKDAREPLPNPVDNEEEDEDIEF